ncbi:MAG: sugar ABC transporter permease [Chloroflexi bacterium]|nr:sugar ABC transporter permease [Chloroflexota bacterium]
MRRPTFWIALFLLPTLVLFGLIYAIPIVTVIATSFTKWNGFGAIEFIGLENYWNLIQSKQFQLAIRNSLLWGLIAAGIHVPFGVLVALVLHRKPFGWRFTRSASMLPNLIPPAALALIYSFLFNPGIGLVNESIRALGFKDFLVHWYFEPETAFFAVTAVWVLYAGVIILITMAELSGIPPDLRESALIDGATDNQVDWHIHLPLLKNIIGVGIIIAVTEVFKMFDYVYLTTGGGPNNQTMSLGLMIYNQATVRYKYGYANAVGVILLVMGLLAFYLVSRAFRLSEPAD